MRDNCSFQNRMIHKELVINEEKNTLFNVYFVWFYVCVCVRDRERERERGREEDEQENKEREKRGKKYGYQERKRS